MPLYRFGDTLVRRKNLYMPCALGPRFDQAPPEEQARIFKETWWADFITNAEWAALLEEPGFSPSAKSRLKRKATGWLMALGRIAFLNPRLYGEAIEAAVSLYQEQVGLEHPVISPTLGGES